MSPNAQKLLELADSYSANGDDENALLYYNKSFSIKPSSEALAGKGVTFTNLKKYNEAKKCFQQSLEINPGNVDALAGVGHCLGQDEDYEGAVKCYDQVIAGGAYGSFKEKIEKCRAFCLFKIGQRQGKPEMFVELALEKLGDEQTKKMDELYNSTKLDECIDYCLKIIEKEPKNRTALGFLTASFLQKHDYDRTVKYCDKILELRPSDTSAIEGKITAFNLKGDELQSRDEFTKAIECYDEVLKLSSLNAHALRARFNAFHKLKKNSEN